MWRKKVIARGSEGLEQCVPVAVCASGSVCPPSLILKKLYNKPATFVSDLIKLWDVEEESECLGQ